MKKMPLWEARAIEIQSYLDQGLTLAKIAEIYGADYAAFRSRICELRKKGLIQQINKKTTANNNDESTQNIGYKESLEIGQDGSYKSDKPLWMTLEQVKDPEYLMKAHGFDPAAWELVTAKNNIWNTNDKIHGIQTLYGSKITVKPKQIGWTFEDLVEAVRANVEPIYIKPTTVQIKDKRMLEIALFDMHFGNCTYDHYQETQYEILSLINSKRWQETLFVIGQDLLHHDNFKSMTSNGTIIQNADMKQAWIDAKQFYCPLIEHAVDKSNRVKIIYSKGNHDESMSWCFVQMLMERYPELEFDDEIKERKVHVFGSNFIGITHGDKARKELTRLFPAEYPLEWSQTTCREIHAGDLHREDLKGMDEWGVMFRTLGTRNKTDQWHEDKGFTTAHKRFMLFEYTTETLKHIHYV